MVLLLSGHPEYGRVVANGPQTVDFVDGALEGVLDVALVVVMAELVLETALAVAERLLDPALWPAATGHPLFTRHEVFALLTAIEPPTPPPTAAAMITTISANNSQKVAARRPKMVRSLGLVSV
jgi:hypothetical protein